MVEKKDADHLLRSSQFDSMSKIGGEVRGRGGVYFGDGNMVVSIIVVISCAWIFNGKVPLESEWVL